MHPTNKTWA